MAKNRLTQSERRWLTGFFRGRFRSRQPLSRLCLCSVLERRRDSAGRGASASVAHRPLRLLLERGNREQQSPGRALPGAPRCRRDSSGPDGASVRDLSAVRGRSRAPRRDHRGGKRDRAFRRHDRGQRCDPHREFPLRLLRWLDRGVRQAEGAVPNRIFQHSRDHSPRTTGGPRLQHALQLPPQGSQPRPRSPVVIGGPRSA